MDGIKVQSAWDNHLDIAIKAWSKERARQLAEKASEVPDGGMERFLVEVLIDALHTFNKDYNSAYNGHVHQLERLMEEMSNRILTPPLIIKS